MVVPRHAARNGDIGPIEAWLSEGNDVNETFTVQAEGYDVDEEGRYYVPVDHAFTDASMSDPTRPQIEVCGDVKVTVYLLGDCRPYHAPGLFDKQLGCSAGCTTLSPAADAWISRAGSYKIEKCEGEL